MQDHAADQLDIEVAHAKDPFTGFPNYRKGFGKKLIEGFPLTQALPEFAGPGPQSFVGEGRNFSLQRVDPIHQRLQPFKVTLVFAAYELSDKASDHRE
jgi:hypothetical protein